MPKFDVVDSAVAGFGLIRRQPLAVLAWGVVLFVLGVLPVTAIIGPWVNAMSDLMGNLHDGPPDMARMEAWQTKFMMLGPIGNLVQLLSLVGRAVVGAAICRAVITPKDSRFAYLRLGMGELFLALVVLAGSIILAMGLVFVILIAVGLGFAVGSMSHNALWVYIPVVCVALVVAVIWLLLRFSMAGPMSVVQKNFRLFESWSLTRGHAGSLFLVGLLNFIVVMLVELVISGLLGGVMVAVVASQGGHLNDAMIEAFFRRPPADIAQALIPWVIGIGFIGSILGAALFAIMLAPWAHVYKALTEPAEG